MNNDQQEDRAIATRQFMNSLNELERVLQAESTISENSAQIDSPASKARAVRPSHPLGLDDLGAMLDDAVEDIEQFMAKAPKDGQRDR